MIRYSLMFLLLALFAAALGIWVLAGTAALIARALIVLFALLFVVSLLWRKPSEPRDN